VPVLDNAVECQGTEMAMPPKKHMPPKKKAPAARAARPKRRRGGRPSLAEAKQLHGRILDAAADIFFDRGYGETSIEAIASRAGIGKLTLYRRFPGKAALFNAVVMRLFDQWIAALANVGDSDGAPGDVLTELGRQMLSIVLSPISIAFHRILFAESSRLPELCAIMYRSRVEAAEGGDPIRVILRRLAARGALRGDDIGFLDQQFIQLIIARPLRHALLGAPPMSEAAREEHVRKSVALFLHGAGVPQRSGAKRRRS
jgi:TetR/AcrR family transcriptional regulator, mexJK operon transcriptional repressor